MKIEELLNKYFEGLTTCEEERRLRHYFTREKNLPHEWEIYRPLFTCLEEEAEAFHYRRFDDEIQYKTVRSVV